MKHTLIKIVALMLVGIVIVFSYSNGRDEAQNLVDHKAKTQYPLAQAREGVTTPGSFYCKSEDAIRKLGSGKKMQEYLFRVGQCGPLGRHEYSEITTGAGDAISKGFWGIAQIVLWLPTGPVEVWVPMEALGY